jgi:hypothetical protein
MSTLSTTNLKNASSASSNIVLNSDGTIGGAALAGVSDVTGINTTGTVTSGTTSMTVASATGITAGMYVVGKGITPGTTVSSIVSTTVTLSANAGVTLSADPVTFYSASKIITPAVVGGQLCRAWVNFNGTGTVAIRASYNVSSITDNGVGDYTVNFTTALADAKYSVNVTGTRHTSVVMDGDYRASLAGTDYMLTSSVRVIFFNTTGLASTADAPAMCVSVFR